VFSEQSAAVVEWMPKKIEDRLEQLRQVRTSSPAEAEAALKKALTDRSNLIAAEAAKLCVELHSRPLIPDLLTALTRFFEDPAKTDPRCWAKTAIVRALSALDYSEAPAFLRAATHIQMEPVYGGQEDSAPHLRASAVLALVQCDDLTRSEILRHLVDALADASETVRIEAVRALQQMNGDEGALVLRLKAHSGDERPAVIGQVFDSLLDLEGERSVRFIARFLDSADPEIRDEAALSLGASRLPVAVELLTACWKDATSRDFRSVLLRALSSSREESALEFLLSLVRVGPDRDASASLEALALHADSPEIQSRIEKAKRDRAQR
jgi:HEAT repeat protein